MLKLTLLPDEYVTIGDIVVQLVRVAGGRADIAIDAPRTVPILRGDVLERNGGRRPDCVVEVPAQYIKQLPWNHKKKQALAELRQTLDQMGDCPEVRALRDKLNVIFPAG